MAGAFPTLSGGTTIMYPFAVKYSCLTSVHRGMNATEQRFVTRAPMVEIEATYTNLTAADQSTIQTFHDSQKGAYDSTWTLAFGGRTYTGMRFLADELEWDETLPNRWSTRLRMAGFHPALVSPPSTLPVLPSGSATQRPWTKRRTYDTNMIDTPAGGRYALAFRGGGLTNFPTGPALAWSLEWRRTTATAADNMAMFFVSKHGRYGSFDFTDPDTTTTHTGCRFGADELTVQYVGYNACSLTAVVEKHV